MSASLHSGDGEGLRLCAPRVWATRTHVRSQPIAAAHTCLRSCCCRIVVVPIRFQVRRGRPLTGPVISLACLCVACLHAIDRWRVALTDRGEEEEPNEL